MVTREIPGWTTGVSRQRGLKVWMWDWPLLPPPHRHPVFEAKWRELWGQGLQLHPSSLPPLLGVGIIWLHLYIYGFVRTSKRRVSSAQGQRGAVLWKGPPEDADSAPLQRGKRSALIKKKNQKKKSVLFFPPQGQGSEQSRSRWSLEVLRTKAVKATKETASERLLLQVLAVVGRTKK